MAQTNIPPSLEKREKVKGPCIVFGLKMSLLLFSLSLYRCLSV